MTFLRPFTSSNLHANVVKLEKKKWIQSKPVLKVIKSRKKMNFNVLFFKICNYLKKRKVCVVCVQVSLFLCTLNS